MVGCPEILWMDRRTVRGKQNCQAGGADKRKCEQKGDREITMVPGSSGKAHRGDGIQAGPSRIPGGVKESNPD